MVTLKKYHGLGNDYLIYDPNQNRELLQERQIQLLCRRNTGVGADGILSGPVFENEKIKVRIFNPDGSEAERSGNGIRIFSKYLKDAGYVIKKELVLQTKSREVTVHYHNEQAGEVTISMGHLYCGQTEPSGESSRKSEFVPVEYNGRKYMGTCVWMGNLHCIVPMEEISKHAVCEIGEKLENSGRFPDGVNTQIIKITDKNNIDTEGYERGAGYTLASGSSCCAAAGVAYQMGLIDPCVYVHMAGGTMKVRIDEKMNAFMTGTAESIGNITLSDEFLRKYQIMAERK